jgi:ABC-type antimicrobial peptide transport system permease subunit
VGLILSLATTRSLASVLYGVKTFDPATFVVAPVLLVAVALLASYIPARRAASVDPVTVLNAE